MSEETKPAEETKPEGSAEKPDWRFVKDFAINGRMKEIVGKTIEASEKELEVLRRKLERLTYGS